MRSRTLYVGAYTRPFPGLAGTPANGIQALAYDEETGELSGRREVTGVENPSFVRVSGNGQVLHAVWEVAEWAEGLVGSYAIDPTTGALSHLGVRGSRGRGPCYVTMDSESRAAFVSNYMSGSVAMFPTRPDGSLAEASSFVQHEGTGPNDQRQQGPHAHCVVVDPTDSFVFSADLGADAIFGYRIDFETGSLTQHSRLDMPPGSGPRHLAFAPDGRFAFIVQELDSTIASLSYDVAAGTLTTIGIHPTLPDDFDGHSQCADVHVHPTDRFVYASNRGHDSIAVFGFDRQNGELELVGHRSTEGSTPRGFAISPDGRFLLVANQDSDNIVTMPINPDTGLLEATTSVVDVPAPVCLKFGF